MHSGSWIQAFWRWRWGRWVGYPWRNQESTFVGLARERKVIQPPASPDREEADELLGDLGACDGLFQVLTKFTMYDILTYIYIYVYQRMYIQLFVSVSLHYYIYIYVCVCVCVGVDLEVHVGNCRGRRCYNMRPRKSLVLCSRNKLFWAKDLAKVHFDEAVYHIYISIIYIYILLSCFSGAKWEPSELNWRNMI